ncbi:MAG: hypothetical protein WBD46_09495 [Acidobacteriaceae bacterium]
MLLVVAAQAAAPVSHEIPAALRGEWVITRLIPTTTLSCWDDRDAKKLLRTTIHYGTDSFQWKDHGVPNTGVTMRSMTAFQFRAGYSGGGAADSEIDFAQLGIRAPSATIVTLSHPDANITGATTEIPGDWVLLKDKDTIVVSVCNLYFEAHRR